MQTGSDFIKGIKGFSEDQLKHELKEGGRFVQYQYCISVIFVSFKEFSSPIFVPAGRSRLLRSWPYTLTSLLLGWWGFPHGIFWTAEALVRNFGGGIDLTKEVSIAIFGQEEQARA